MKQEPVKRIVSKGEYARVQADRASGLAIGSSLWLTAIVFASFACVSGIVMIYGVGTFAWSCASRRPMLDCLLPSIIAFVLLFLFGYCSHVLYWGGKTLIREATEVDPGIPLTRANATYLPASNSLVRASHEPLQSQQSVLLRAAREATETREEQLLRASLKGQE